MHNVRDRHGRLVRRKERSHRIDTRDGGVGLAMVLAEYCDNNQPHIAVVESTYNIYFVADIFEIKGWNFLIADPCAVSFARLLKTFAKLCVKAIRSLAARIASARTGDCQSFFISQTALDTCRKMCPQYRRYSVL